MRILRAAGHRVMPWKNGGGITTEIAVFPEGAGLDTFEWRLSMATVSTDGPFSLFAGVDRTLAVLKGEGIVLSVEGLPEATLTRASPPLAFPADRNALARLISGPILDLNVMTRRGFWTHHVERLSSGGSHAVGHDDAVTIVFCAADAVSVTSDAVPARLARHDAAIVDGPVELAMDDDPEVYVVRLEKSRR